MLQKSSRSRDANTGKASDEQADGEACLSQDHLLVKLGFGSLLTLITLVSSLLYVDMLQEKEEEMSSGCKPGLKVWDASRKDMISFCVWDSQESVNFEEFLSSPNGSQKIVGWPKNLSRVFHQHGMET